MGSCDWEMLERIQKFHAQHLELLQEFSEFMQRKSVANNPNYIRVNLGTCNQARLLFIYKIVKECQVSTKFGETIVDIDAARAKGLLVLRQESIRRFQVQVENSEGDKITTYVYTVMFYFEPSPCWFQFTDNSFCGKFHWTIFEYRDADPSVDISSLGLSHLWHQSWDISSNRIVIEPNSKTCASVYVCVNNFLLVIQILEQL